MGFCPVSVTLGVLVRMGVKNFVRSGYFSYHRAGDVRAFDTRRRVPTFGLDAGSSGGFG